jgi:putative transposase
VVCDAHEGLKHAIGRILGSTWQRCPVHFMRNALARVPKGRYTVVAAAFRQAFLQADAATAHQTWRQSLPRAATRGRRSAPCSMAQARPADGLQRA